MPTHVALLRAVNLGAHGKIAMADLRAVFEALGFSGAKTLLQTGNVLFDAGGRSEAEVEAALEAAVADRLSHRTAILVRGAAEWDEAVAANPYEAMARDDPSRLVLFSLRAAPAEGAVAALRAAIKGRETVEVRGRFAYVAFPDGIGTSKLTSRLIEHRLGVTGTARNWNTTLKVAAGLSDAPPP